MPSQRSWAIAALPFLLAACQSATTPPESPDGDPGAAAPTAVSSVAEDPAAPTSVPPVGPPGLEACPPSGADTDALISAQDGFCLAYPTGLDVTSSDPGAPARTTTLSFPPADPGATESAGPSLSIEVTDAPVDAGLASMVDDRLTDVLADPAVEIERSELEIGGQPAIVVDGLPGLTLTRQAFVVHAGRLYTLTVTPWDDPGFADRQADAESLWRTGTESIAFFDPSIATWGVSTPNPEAPNGTTSGGAAPNPDIPTGPAVSVSEALASPHDGALIVAGYVLVRDGEPRLCEALAESFPPQCGQPSLALEGLEIGDLSDVQAEGAVLWTDSPVELTGKVFGANLLVIPMVDG